MRAEAFAINAASQRLPIAIGTFCIANAKKHFIFVINIQLTMP